MFDTLRKLYGILEAREKRRAILLFFILIAVAIAEVVGVGSVMPFMAVVADPSSVQSNEVLATAYKYLGFQSTESFLIFLGGVFFVILIGSLVLKAAGQWAQLRFSTMRIHGIGCKLITGYLGQPYQWFLNQHSSGLGATILSEVNQVVTQALFPTMQIVANSMISLFLIALLVVMDPALALSAAAIVGVAYTGIFLSARRYLERIGVERREANRARFRAVEEAFGGVKDIKIIGLESAYVKKFHGPSLRLAKRRVASALISELPAFAMQGLIFGGMLLVLLYLMTTQGGFREALPLISVYAFAAYRLMPALQKVYKNIATVRFSKAAVDALYDDIKALEAAQAASNVSRPRLENVEKLPLVDSLQLRNVSYSYPNSDEPTLKSLSLSIRANQSIGFVGSTGSGKTTTADLILGLLRPQSGELLVDGKVLSDADVYRWQRNLGYVPQQIFLADDTIAGNIAFGIPKRQIDREAVERAARIASLHEFVSCELSEGYDTEVGERGVRLSGGQRQRIGIARALYHDPAVLILDEATSALDSLTEKIVMEAVNNVGHSKTVILIAHRLSTVRNCDRIFVMERGEIAAAGTYAELLESSDLFQRMAAVGE